MALMAQKLEASLALEGQFSADGLAAMSADSGSLTMELAKSLVENLDFGDADRVWERAARTQSGPCDALPAADDGILEQEKDADELVECLPRRMDSQRLRCLPEHGTMRQLNLFSELVGDDDEMRIESLPARRKPRYMRRNACRR